MFSKRYARVHSLSFEMPRPDSDIVIRAEVHYVQVDNNEQVTFISGTEVDVFRLLSRVAHQSVQFSDSVQKTNYELTLAGLAAGITQAVRSWMMAEIPGGKVDSQGRYVLDLEEN